MIAWDVVSVIKASAPAKQASKVMIAVGRFQHRRQVLCLQLQLPLHLHRETWGTQLHSSQTICHQFVQKNAIRMASAMMTDHASVSQVTVEQLARISAHSCAMVKANALTVPACVWLVKLAWIAVCPFAVLVMATATSQTCASAIVVGQAPIAASPCLALTPSAQAMVHVLMGFANASLDGRVQSVRAHLWSVNLLVLPMVHAIAQLAPAHVKQAGAVTIAPWGCRLLQRKRQLQMRRRKQPRMQ